MSAILGEVLALGACRLVGRLMGSLDTISALLDNAALGDGRVTFLADRVEMPVGELWARAERAAAYFRDSTGPGGVVALLMETSPECLVSLLGGLRAGVKVLSLPYPARGTGLEEYGRLLTHISDLSGVEMVALPGRFAGVVPDQRLRAVAYDECAGYAKRADIVEPGELVQFSSGSTGRPKGVRLSPQAIAANVTATLDHIAPHGEGMVGCSWLPLSHDMGLIGMCLTVLVSMGAPWDGRGLALLPPDSFVSRPASWLEACSAVGATVTCTPNFGLDLVQRHVRLLPPSASLLPLRVLIVGSELIRAATLRRFAEAVAPLGFDERALCPAYGMAEATLAVSMVRPAGRWRSLTVGRDAPGGGETEIVSCGAPLRGLEVRAPDRSQGSGPIAIRGTTLLSGYLGEPGSGLRDGWLETSDIGFMSDGELFVMGRVDDVIIVAGRKFYPEELERTVECHPALRAGNCAAIPDDSGGYVVIAERSRAEPPSDLPDVCRWVRRELATRHGVAPAEVTVVSPGTLPKTPSGKLQRKRLRLLRTQAELSVEAQMEFGRG